MALDITTAIIATFRTDFEGFADDTAWTDAKVTRALQRADHETGSARWGDYSDFSIKQRGMFNFAAHSLSIAKANATSTQSGGTPSAIAPVQSKSVGDESVTYAINTADLSSDDAVLATTSYGQEFMRLRRRVKLGGSSSNA